MDKRKNNGGNSTKSSRPDDKRKRSVRLAISEDLEAMSEDWKKAMHQQIKKGNMAALKLWSEYVLGKPSQSLVIEKKEPMTLEEARIKSLELDKLQEGSDV